MRTTRKILAAAPLALLLSVSGPAQEMRPDIKGNPVPHQEARPATQPGGNLPQPIPGSSGASESAPQVPEREPNEIGVDSVYLRLVLRVSPSGSVRVVDASEEQGTVQLSDYQVGSLIYEVADAQSTLAVASLVDPFDVHGTPGKGPGQQTPYVMQVPESEVVVRVPNAKLGSVGNLNVRIHEILPGTPRTRITPAAVSRMIQQNQVKTLLSAPLAVASIVPNALSVAPGKTVQFTLTAPNSTGLNYVAASSFGRKTLMIDTRRLDLTPDVLLAITLYNLLPNTFSGYRGRIDQAGTGKAAINVPTLAGLSGTDIHTAFVTLDPKAPSGIKAISDTVAIRIR